MNSPDPRTPIGSPPMDCSMAGAAAEARYARRSNRCCFTRSGAVGLQPDVLRLSGEPGGPQRQGTGRLARAKRRELRRGAVGLRLAQRGVGIRPAAHHAARRIEDLRGVLQEAPAGVLAGDVVAENRRPRPDACPPSPRNGDPPRAGATGRRPVPRREAGPARRDRRPAPATRTPCRPSTRTAARRGNRRSPPPIRSRSRRDRARPGS